MDRGAGGVVLVGCGHAFVTVLTHTRIPFFGLVGGTGGVVLCSFYVMKVQKIVLIIVIAVVVVGLAAYLLVTRQPAGPDTTGWTQYKSEAFGIELKYPAAALTAPQSDQYAPSLFFADAAAPGAPDLSVSYLNIELAPGDSINAFLEAGLSKNPFSTTLEIVSQEETRVGGKRAVRVVMTMGNEEKKFALPPFTVVELPRPISREVRPTETFRVGEPVMPGVMTYYLMKFSGSARDPNLIEQVIKTVRFVETR